MIVFGRIKRTVQHWLKIDGTFLAAAVTFYAAMALFPLTLVMLSLFGWSLSSSEFVQDWRDQFLELITKRTSENFSEIIKSQLAIIEANAKLSGSIGGLTFLAFSIALFTNLERAFDRIWELRKEQLGFISAFRRFMFYRIRAFLMILLLVLIVLGNFIFNIYLDKMEVYITSWIEGEFFSWLVQIASELALNAVMFTGVFQIMTRDKVKWVNAIYGGFLTALLWQPGRYIIATYLISERYTPFGVVGAFLAVLLWIFYGFNVLLFGGTVVCVAGKENTAASESNIESDSESSEELAR